MVGMSEWETTGVGLRWFFWCAVQSIVGGLREASVPVKSCLAYG